MLSPDVRLLSGASQCGHSPSKFFPENPTLNYHSPFWLEPPQHFPAACPGPTPSLSHHLHPYVQTGPKYSPVPLPLFQLPSPTTKFILTLTFAPSPLHPSIAWCRSWKRVGVQGAPVHSPSRDSASLCDPQKDFHLVCSYAHDHPPNFPNGFDPQGIVVFQNWPG